MKLQFTKDTFLFIFAILPGIIVYSLFVNVSHAYAWASAYGTVTFNGSGVSGVEVSYTEDCSQKGAGGGGGGGGGGNDRFNPREPDIEREPRGGFRELDALPKDFNLIQLAKSGYRTVSPSSKGVVLGSKSTVTDGTGRFSLEGLDCACTGQTISVLGSSISIPDMNNAVNYGPFNIIYNVDPPPPPPPTAVPLPTNTPMPTPTPLPVCGGPCDFIKTNCPLDCAICAPNKEGKNVCSKTHTESSGSPSSQGLYANFLSPLSYKDFPTPTMSFMQLKLGELKK